MNKESRNMFTRGMNWITDNPQVSDQNYEYALNAVIEDRDGKVGSLITEHSNFHCLDIETGYKVIGHVTAFTESKKEEVLFITNDVMSKIIVIDTKDCKQRVIVQSACLAFKKNEAVNALLKIKKNKERIVYFTDGINPYRVINIDKPEYYLDINNPDSNTNLVCDRLLFSPKIEPLEINISGIKEGGQLDMGSYKFYARYVSEDLSYTNIIGETESVMIDRNNAGTDYMKADGGYNITSDGQGASERYPRSSKSIELSLRNLDRNFKYIQIEIVGYTGGSGAITVTERSRLLPIGDSVLKWIYTGNNGIKDISLEDITIDKPIIKKVKAHVQKDNRLFIAGTTEDNNLKWQAIQRSALKIKTSWKTAAVRKFDRGQGVQEQFQGINTSIPGNSKSNVLNKSFMRDEVYALGIYGILDDGSTTPVFHIPGREKRSDIYSNRIRPWANTAHPMNNFVYNRIGDMNVSGWDWDNEGMQIDFSYSNPLGDTFKTVQAHEVQHLERYRAVDGTIPRHKIFNTAYITAYDGLDFTGELAYYECDTLYPDIKIPSLNGDIRLYGDLTNTPIRHHKMPDTNLVPHVDSRVQLGGGGFVYPLELDINLTDFLSDLLNIAPDIYNKVKKWEICSGERTEGNKTVLDKGITTWDEQDRGAQSYWTQGMHLEGYDTTNSIQQSGKVRFHSPKTLIKKENLNGTHYKVEGYVDANQNSFTRDYRQFSGEIFHEVYDYVGKTTTLYTSANQVRLSNFPILNWSYVSDTVMVKKVESFTQGYPFLNAEGMRNYAYTPHFMSITLGHGYGIMNPNKHTYVNGSSAQSVNSGKMGYFTYGALKNERSVYDALESITYFKMPQYPLASSIGHINYKGGDTFITPMFLEISGFVDIKDDKDPSGYDQPSGAQGYVRQAYYQWVESDINMGMRHSKNTYNKADGDIYYQGWASTDGLSNLFKTVAGGTSWIEYVYLQAGVAQGANIGSEAGIGSNTADLRCFKQALLYNVDYGHFYGVRPKYPLSLFHDYSNEKDIVNHYRIRYSEKDIQDTISDLYRVMKPNNYATQDAQLGDIIDLFNDKAELYSRTVKTVVHVPTNMQTVKTDQVNIYLGTGSVIPYDPRPIVNVPYVYGGGSNFQERLNTEFGTVLLDRKTKKVYLMREGLEDISLEMQPFFSEFLHSDFERYNIYDTRDQVIIWYDTYKKRIMISANLFRFNDDTRNKLNNNTWTLIQAPDFESLLIYDDTSNNSLTGGYVSKLFSWEDPFSSGFIPYLENLGNFERWTISYSLEAKSWTSFHSYVPDYAFALNRGFAGMYGNKVYVHQETEVPNQLVPERYLNFNNITYPFIIDYSINDTPQAVKSLNGINIYSENNKWTSMIIYNDENKMNTGEVELLPQSQDNNPAIGDVYKATISSKEGYFKIDNIRDRVKDRSLLIWQKNTRREKILNVSNIDTSSFFNMNQGLIRGNSIKVRLKYIQTSLIKGRQSLWMILNNINLINR